MEPCDNTFVRVTVIWLVSTISYYIESIRNSNINLLDIKTKFLHWLTIK